MVEKLQEWATERGYRIALGSAAVLEDVRRDIGGRLSESQIDRRFFEHALKDILGSQFDNGGRTVILVAKPRPAHLVHFDMDGNSIGTLLPPTYFRYRATFEEVLLDLRENVRVGAGVEMLNAPLKNVAARLGLISYGRNNITYVPGLGSYFQLCGYITDAIFPDPEPRIPMLLQECEDCSLCVQMCPTGAIQRDRILLRAEKCLTYANEDVGDWPNWVDPRVHSCLLGCLDCQRCCPANPDLIIEDTGVLFSDAETRLLLSQDLSSMGAGAENGIRSKLAWLGQPYVEPFLGRNLRALLRAKNLRV